MNKADTIKFASTILAIIITLIGTLLAIDKYFAKSAVVQLIEERLDISIQDDRIFQQQQDVERLKGLFTFRRRDSPPTPNEQEVLKLQEKRLDELKKVRQQKIERYEKRK